ncbi:MAG: hypothetical protein R3F37_10740 [Candidatus Competibacteraceae bacterium]
MVWLLTLLPVAATALTPRRYRLGLLVLMVLLLGLWFWNGGFSAALPGLGTVYLQPERIEIPYLAASTSLIRQIGNRFCTTFRARQLAFVLVCIHPAGLGGITENSRGQAVTGLFSRCRFGVGHAVLFIRDDRSARMGGEIHQHQPVVSTYRAVIDVLRPHPVSRPAFPNSRYKAAI